MLSGEWPITEEGLVKKHAQERTLLQAEVQKLKKEAAKGDRKKKNEVSEKVALLEASLDERHERELVELRRTQQSLQQADEHEGLACADANQSINGAQNSVSGAKKPSKAQKRKEKKSLAEKERDQQIMEQEALNVQGSRHLENEVLEGLLGKRGLELVSVPADGDCLYAAVQYQLQCLGTQFTVAQLRHRTAEYMREHSDEFLPYMSDEAGQPMDFEAFDLYCQKIECSPEWGGQLEICALSHILQRPVEVIQADAVLHVIGEQYNKADTILLVYHKHLYGLGEHYSSAVPLLCKDLDVQ